MWLGQWACLGTKDAAAFILSLPLTIHTCFAGQFWQCSLYFFFLCTKMSTKTFFQHQRSKPSCPVRQTAGDMLAGSCETMLNVAKESFIHFSDVGEKKKACSVLLCRPWHGYLKRLFWSISCFTCKFSLAGGDIQNEITVQTETEQ